MSRNSWTSCYACATSTLVDGGISANSPIDTSDRADGKPPLWPTFGITAAELFLSTWD